MTKKDYVAIASAISKVRKVGEGTPDATECHIHGTCNLITYEIADVLRADNPKFDRSRFLAACGVK